jgi:hypothetical protein
MIDELCAQTENTNDSQDSRDPLINGSCNNIDFSTDLQTSINNSSSSKDKEHLLSDCEFCIIGLNNECISKEFKLDNNSKNVVNIQKHFSANFYKANVPFEFDSVSKQSELSDSEMSIIPCVEEKTVELGQVKEFSLYNFNFCSCIANGKKSPNVCFKDCVYNSKGCHHSLDNGMSKVREYISVCDVCFLKISQLVDFGPFMGSEYYKLL